MNIKIMIQARSFSKRFPRKIYAELKGVTVLERIYKIADKALPGSVIVIGHAGDQELVDFCKKHEMNYFIASEKVQPYNLVQRFVEAMNKFGGDAFVRLTSDCPAIPSELIKLGLEKFIQNKYDYLSNTCIRSYPDGYDLQISSRKCLDWYAGRCRETFYLEHPFSAIDMNISWRNNMIKNGMRIGHIFDSTNPIFTKISLDNEADKTNIEKWLEDKDELARQSK